MSMMEMSSSENSLMISSLKSSRGVICGRPRFLVAFGSAAVVVTDSVAGMSSSLSDPDEVGILSVMDILYSVWQNWGSLAGMVE